MAEVISNVVRSGLPSEVTGSYLEGREVVVVAANEERVVLQDKETGEILIVWPSIECETRDCDGPDDPWIHLRFTARR